MPYQQRWRKAIVWTISPRRPKPRRAHDVACAGASWKGQASKMALNKYTASGCRGAERRWELGELHRHLRCGIQEVGTFESATDRNQSGELLELFAKGAAFTDLHDVFYGCLDIFIREHAFPNQNPLRTQRARSEAHCCCLCAALEGRSFKALRKSSCGRFWFLGCCALHPGNDPAWRQSLP